MAANKFATMMHRNTNKITLILIYAVLEWILIVLLLLNSLFSYLILKFADYFGLPRPCLWCSRLDHLFDSGKDRNHYRDLICKDHASEISGLGFCSNHQKLVELQELCEDCSSSQPADSTIRDNSEAHVSCSCCGLLVERKFNFPSLSGHLTTEEGESDVAAVVNGRSDVSGDLEEEEEFGEFKVSDGAIAFEFEEGKESSPCPILSSESGIREMVADEDEKLVMVMEVQDKREEDDYQTMAPVEDDSTKNKSAEVEIPAHHLEFYIGGDDCELIPVEWISSTTGKLSPLVEEDNSGYQDVIMDFCLPAKSKPDRRIERVTLFPIHESDEEHKIDGISEAADGDCTEGEGEGEQVATAHTAEIEIVPEVVESDYVRERDEPFATAQTADLENVLETIGGDYTQDRDEALATAQTADIPENGDDVRETATQDGDEQLAAVQTVDTLENGNEIRETAMQDGDEQLDAAKTVDTPENGNEVREIAMQDGDEQIAAAYIADIPETGNEVRETTMQDGDEQIAATQTADIPENVNVVRETVMQEGEGVEIHSADEGYGSHNDETDAEVSIGTEIPDYEPIDDIHTEDILSSTGHDILHSDNAHDEDFMQIEEGTLEFRTIYTETDELAGSCQLPLITELNENEDDKIPDTPTSIDSLHQLHRKLLLLEKRESGMSEESLDGSVTSEIEGSEGPLTVDQLKSALRAERKALHALYAELEEERSASAVAASQTMAMINRLQEEKAAMQMEALQYQRMMEEQSEYDQEALQLLNDLMVKREREKQELEKELEIYRKKVEEFEAKERMGGMLLRSKDKNSSASCSNAEEDSEGLSIDLNEEAKEDDHFFIHHQHDNNSTPSDAILYSEDSLANFEEERQSILDQLKVLEEKLLPEDVSHCKENGNGHSNGEVNGSGENGHYKMNGKHYQHGRFMGPKAKTLLPLFNAIGEETDDTMQNGHKQDCNGDWLQKTPPDVEMVKNNDIEDEVDQLYERLHVLETDREF